MLPEVKEFLNSGKRAWDNLERRRVKQRRYRLEILLQAARSAFDLMSLTLESDQDINNTWQGKGDAPMTPEKRHHLGRIVEVFSSRLLKKIASRRGALYSEEHNLAAKADGLEGEPDPYIESGSPDRSLTRDQVRGVEQHLGLETGALSPLRVIKEPPAQDQ